MHTALIVKAMLLNEAGEVLVLRRSETDDRRPGEIDIPGGTAETGEDVLEAGAREVLEETGLELQPQDMTVLFASTKKDDEKRAIVTRVLCGGRIANQEIKLSFEHDQYEWISIESAIERFDGHGWGLNIQFVYDHQLLA